MADGYSLSEPSPQSLWAELDLEVLHPRRPPPPLPLDVFGPQWKDWIVKTAAAASCPPDYVACTLLAAASALIGNARWAQATPGWSEPPHLWVGAVGDSGGGKSPGADEIMRNIVPVIEARMGSKFPDEHRDWKAKNAEHEAAMERWKQDVKQAGKNSNPPPLPPLDPPPEPQMPRLRQNDVTIERVASILASAAPKGLLVVRDELAGWFAGMTSYNDSGRAFWLEAYGGRPYRVERQKHPLPIDVPRLAVSVTGGTQPDKLVEMMDEADDGMLARMCWLWPDPVPFHLALAAPATVWATEALDKLRRLDLAPSPNRNAIGVPIMVPLVDLARALIEDFGQDMQERQEIADGLMRSAYGKARGTALRISLVLEFLWWCGASDIESPPAVISTEAFEAAALFVSDYLMPMAERVYGDAATSSADRAAATLARWIMKDHPSEVHVRHLQREVRLTGLKNAEDIEAAANALVAAGWLAPPARGDNKGRARNAYRVNPALFAGT